MDFNSPAETNPIDQARIVGKPTARIDGPRKTTGTAPYAYERHDVAEGQLIGYPLGAAVAKGRIVSMDTGAAKASPGVVAIVKATDMDALPIASKQHTANLFGGNKVEHYHQAIAVVVAETFEQARAATALIEVEYDEDDDASFDLSAALARMADQPIEPSESKGDFETAFANAAHKLDRTYTTPGHSHSQMEPHSSIASWDEDGNLTVWTSSQMIQWAKEATAKVFSLDPEKVRIDSPYIGGGFGGKLFIRSDLVLAALGSRETGRPVKVALPRPLIMNNTTHRSQTIQRIRIGTDATGKIVAVAHDNISNALPGGRGENATLQTPHFYSAETMRIVNRVAETHLVESNAMRAPGETPGHMALEIAMDEMAEMLGMDPVEFRIVNDAQSDPETGKPFSERHLVECLQRGSQMFGWAGRNRAPGATRDGAWMIGHGVAGSYRDGPAKDSAARVRLLPGGRLIVETDMTDIGTGSYTIIAQTAAEMLGLELDQVEVRLGDSDYPVSSGSGGQFGATSSTAGTYAACVALREEIARRMGNAQASSLEFSGGSVMSGDRRTSLTEIAADGEIVAEDTITFGDFQKDLMITTFGAHFVEVGVHASTGEIRVRRMLAVCDAGRILNPISARSQVLGGMTMGVGAALMEEAALDRNKGFFANHDLAGYEVAVHADIPEQTVVFLDTLDPAASPMKAKGVGELGLCGVSAAVANAVYNATGVRVRSYPVTLDKIIGGLPTA